MLPKVTERQGEHSDGGLRLVGGVVLPPTGDKRWEQDDNIIKGDRNKVVRHLDSERDNIARGIGAARQAD